MSHPTHPSFDPTCGVCASLRGPAPLRPLFENELWHVRHVGAPYGVAGWMMLVSRRHVAGPGQFDHREAASFGLTLCHLQRVLEEVTGALRIYTAAMGESSPHFHAHMVPRYATMPKDAKAWGVFDLQRAASAGEIAVPEAEVQRLCEAYATALAVRPPPAP
jgi:diadenosine tetraphosphate (Ap4A) HIT family hydrolase